MSTFRISFATFVFIALTGLATPAQAELLVNEWSPFEFPILQDPEAPCANDPVFLAQGMQHLKVSTLRNGGLAINFNALGTFTGLETGEEWHWRHNFADVLPIFGDNRVGTYQDTLKIIGQRGNPTYFAKVRVHVTEIGGEMKSYFEVEEITCK